ncbi:hypothetical protein GCM10011508_17020 [Flavobacterium lutivivi]|jgi:hypothetical protein|nr:hypothetical protein GCM10011508_17020 [Flavobacterium lutivivi]
MFGEFGINKTVGWAWDLTSFIIPLFVIYISTYLTLYFLKVKMNLIFSILSILFLLITFYLASSNTNLFVTFTSSLLLFVTNCIYSIYLKFKKSH